MIETLLFVLLFGFFLILIYFETLDRDQEKEELLSSVKYYLSKGEHANDLAITVMNKYLSKSNREKFLSLFKTFYYNEYKKPFDITSDLTYFESTKIAKQMRDYLSK